MPASALARLAVIAALLPLAACASFGSRAPTPRADPTSLRETTEGPVIGFRDRFSTHAWLGVPFAQPPVGALRWKAPRAPEARSSGFEALRFAPPCAQPALPIGGVKGAVGSLAGSEDCLYLNIWAPRLRPDQLPGNGERLPVMVWIHGGGNVVGTPEQTPGHRLAGEYGVLLVSVAYRLGPLGWFRHPALSAPGDSAEDHSGNFGTLDLIRALEWVRDNAGSFGGDPQRVTVFGESAGGVNVFALLASPLAKRLFQRAIVQSGRPRSFALAEVENRTDQEPPGRPWSSSEITLRLLVLQGRARDRAEAVQIAGTLPASDLQALLRGASPEQLLDLGAIDLATLTERPTVFADGHVLPAQPLDAHLQAPAGIPRMPVMLGTNRDETRAFQLLDRTHVRWRLGLFPRARDPDAYLRTARYTSAMWKAVGADEPARVWSAAGSDVFVYRFDWDDEPVRLVADLRLLVGASHALELPFVFGVVDALGDLGFTLFTSENAEGREELSRAMMAYWSQFAATGDPGRGRAGSLPAWQSWRDAADGHFMVLDTSSDAGLRMSEETVSREKLVREMLGDPALQSLEPRCALTLEIGRFGEWSADQLQALSCPGVGSAPEP
jgi:para-nitrobenzyl esterase